MEMLEHRLVLSSFLVTNAEDSGEGSLRWAIDQANLTSGADAITFDASLADQPIVLGGTELSVTDDLTITGLGADKLTISGNNASRVFSIAAGVAVEISGVTIVDGKASIGGGIYNEGTLTVENSTLRDSLTDGYGGAICNYSTEGQFPPSLAIANCTFTGNRGSQGGGVANVNRQNDKNSGTVTITGSTFRGNSASSGGAIYEWADSWRPKGTVVVTESTLLANSASVGGAVYFNNGLGKIASSTFSNNTASSWGGVICMWHRSTVVDIDDSTLSGNSAGSEGGAIENCFGTLRIANSTISGNSTDGVGGAIYNWGGSLTITNGTLTANRADANGDGYGDGGVLYDDGGGLYLLHNTIAAGNRRGLPGSDSPNDFSATLDSASSHNLIGDAATAGGLEDGKNGNIVGDGGVGTIDITTVLDPILADNGGPTLTHALVAGSPAMNAGDNSKAVDPEGNPLVYDQRGEGFARIVDGTVDIGALEVQPQILSVEIDVKPASDPNSINLASNGLIAVAIFTTDSFDAALVNASTVQFAGASAVHWAMEDVDGDGDLDMVLHFRVQDTNLADLYGQLLADDFDGDGSFDSSLQTAAVSLTGLTAADECFEGFDDVDLFLSGKHLRELLEDLAAEGVI